MRVRVQRSRNNCARKGGGWERGYLYLSLCKVGCIATYIHVLVFTCLCLCTHMYMYMQMHIYLQLGCDKADYKGGVRYTKNVVKSEMLDCDCTVYNNSEYLVYPINT